MSYSEQFIIKNRLLPGDAILLRKKLVGMLDHFAVYLGRHPETNEPIFAANNFEGVEVIPTKKADIFLKKLVPEKIERFIGTPQERKSAIKRALSVPKGTKYNLITNNCEHYKNLVQYGRKYSPQVKNAGIGLLAAGGATAITGLASKNKNVALIGAAGLVLGGILAGLADQDD